MVAAQWKTTSMFSARMLWSSLLRSSSGSVRSLLTATIFSAKSGCSFCNLSNNWAGKLWKLSQNGARVIVSKYSCNSSSINNLPVIGCTAEYLFKEKFVFPCLLLVVFVVHADGRMPYFLSIPPATDPSSLYSSFLTPPYLETDYGSIANLQSPKIRSLLHKLNKSKSALTAML